MLFLDYKKRADQILCEEHADHHKALLDLENQVTAAAELGETDRRELQAYMEEYRLQKLNATG